MAVQAQVSDLFKQGAGVGGLVLEPSDFRRVERRLYRQGEGSSLVKSGLVGKPKANLIEVQKTQRGRAQLREFGGMLALRFDAV